MDLTSILVLLLAFIPLAFLIQLIWRKPLYGLLAYAFFFPLFPIEAGIKLLINFRWQQLCALIFLLPPIIKMILNKRNLDKFDTIVFLYIVCSSISVFFLVGPYSFFGQVYKNILYILLPFLAFRYIPKSKNDIEKILIALILSGLIVSFEGIAEFIFEKRIFLDFPLILDPRYELGNPFRFGVKRVFASFYDPVYLGSYIGIIAILGVYVFIYSKKRLHSLIASFQIFLTPLIFLFSQARTAVVSIAVIVPFLLFTESKKKIIKLFLRLSLISIIIILIVLHTNIYDINKLTNSVNDVVYYGVLDSSASFNLEGRWDTSIYGLEISWPPNFFGERSLEIFNKLYNHFGMADIGNGFVSKLCWEGLIPAILFYGLVFIFMWFLFRRRSIDPIVKYLLISLLYFWIADQLTAQMALITIFWWILGGIAMCIEEIAKVPYPQIDNYLAS